MSCDEVKSQLGELLDGELSDEKRMAVEQHLDDCQACRAEHDILSTMVAGIATPPIVALPVDLWRSIEVRLDTVPSHAGPAVASHPKRNWVIQLARRPLTAAAVILLAVGFGWLAVNAPWEPRAMAAQIDFRPLLEHANGDIAAGIRALIQTYGGAPITQDDAAKRMNIRIHAPDQLPGELRLESRFLLNMGDHHQALAFHYVGPKGHLLLIQCPPGVEKDYGNYECLPCSVGPHDGHGVRVGKLYLMHMDSENVCVCVVSTLDEHKDLPVALGAVQIDF